MRTKPLFLFLITTIFLTVIFIISCKKQASTTSVISTDDNLSVKFARKYFYNTLRKVPINNLAISSVEEKANAKIYPFWQEAYSSTTDKYSFIEVPITSTKAPFILYSFTGKDEPKRVSDKSILDISFKRLVMYKNKAGVINERIITYLPDRSYALKHHNDVSHNHINNLDKDFTGYLEYSNWDLKRLFVLRLVNGVVVRKADLRSEMVRMSTDLTINAIDNDNLKTNETCETFEDPIYFETCYTAADPSSPTGTQGDCTEEIIGYNRYQVCTPDYCDDPANFNTAECGGDTGGGGGVGGGGGSGNAIRVVTNDPSVLSDPKANCMISNVANSSNSAYNKFLAAFIGSNTYNVTFKMQANCVVNGVTVDAYTYFSDTNPNVTIYLSSAKIDANSSAEDARTIIHEMAHTYLAQKIISVGGPGNLGNNLDKSFQDLFEDYAKYIDPTTGNYKATANNSAQHEYMAENLINDIAQGIKDYVEANTPSIKTDTSVTMDNYKALAWSTLTGTAAYTEFLTKSGETVFTQTTKVSVLKTGTSNDRHSN